MSSWPASLHSETLTQNTKGVQNEIEEEVGRGEKKENRKVVF